MIPTLSRSLWRSCVEIRLNVGLGQGRIKDRCGLHPSQESITGRMIITKRPMIAKSGEEPFVSEQIRWAAEAMTEGGFGNTISIHRHGRRWSVPYHIQL